MTPTLQKPRSVGSFFAVAQGGHAARRRHDALPREACAGQKRDDTLTGLLSPYSTDAWVNFMVAEAGASAALTGLIFVAVSINLEKILSYPSLPGRAAESIVELFSVLIIASFCLVPGESRSLLGWEMLLFGLGMWIVVGLLQARYILKHRTEPWHWMGLRIMFGLLTSVPVCVAGISLLVQAGGGLYWLVPAILFSFIAGVFHAWVLLIEILR